MSIAFDRCSNCKTAICLLCWNSCDKQVCIVLTHRHRLLAVQWLTHRLNRLSVTSQRIRAGVQGHHYFHFRRVVVRVLLWLWGSHRLLSSARIHDQQNMHEHNIQFKQCLCHDATSLHALVGFVVVWYLSVLKRFLDESCLSQSV